MVDMKDVRGILPVKPVIFIHQLRAFIRAKNLAYETVFIWARVTFLFLG